MRTKLFSTSFIMLLLVGLFITANARLASDSLDLPVYGSVYENDCAVDTIKSATDSAVIKDLWRVPANQKGCIFTLSMPAITGTGSDSVKAYLSVKGYDKNGNYVFTYPTKDTIIASTACRLILPIETPVCVADKYTILWYAYTASGGQVIWPNTKIYALKRYIKQD